MTHIFIILAIILIIVSYTVCIDILLSWLRVFGLQIRPSFIASIVDPLYSLVRGRIATKFGPFELTAIIILIFISLILRIIYSVSPETYLQVQGIINPLLF